MTRGEFLAIPKMERRIALLTSSVAALRSLATSLSAPIGGDRVQASGSSDRVGRLVAEIADAEVEMEKEIQRITELRLEALTMIKELQDPERTVMYLRYIAGMNWERIGDEVHYEYHYLFRIRHKALRELFPEDNAG